MFSEMFKTNFVFLNIFGLWTGRYGSRYFIYYSNPFLLINLIIYYIVLTVNLIYTPRKIEFVIREVIFYFTEIAVIAKVYMILKHTKNMNVLSDIINNNLFEGSDINNRSIVTKSIISYKKTYKLYAIISHVAYTSLVFFPIIGYTFFNSTLELPICKYYFLNEDTVNNYFTFWFIYQSFGMYSHMQYNLNVDSLISGLLFITLTQLKLLNLELRFFKMSKQETVNGQGRLRFKKILEHFKLVLKYSAELQNVISFTMFVQFGVASAVICVVLCGLTLPSSTEIFIFMILYLGLMTAQIFVPSWLGTQILYESQELMFAAYSCEWISMPQNFKKSLLIFVGRAKLRIQFTGLYLFCLSLETFTSIMKTAYSLFTLIRKVQEKEK